ncbi:MAG: heparin lyase I family protein [Alphaproteobacteria bacterium]|nr:heparin lyase I family protein [Alphaproteobacteria bacterium]
MRVLLAVFILICAMQTAQAATITNLKKSGCGEYEDKNVKLHAMNTPFSREFKKLRKQMNKATNNSFYKYLMPKEINVEAKDSVTISSLKGENTIRIRYGPDVVGAAGDWQRFGESGYAQRLQFFENDGGLEKDKEMWYRLGFYIPKDYKTSWHSLSFFDFKHVKDCADIDAPIVSMNLRPEGLNVFLTKSFDYANCVRSEVTSHCNKEEFVISFGQGHQDKWIMLVMNVKWSETDGFFRMWMNGSQVINYAGGFLLREADAVRFKFGPYRIGLDKERNIPAVDIHYTGVGRAKTCDKLWKGCERLLNDALAENTVRTTRNRKNGPMPQSIAYCDTRFSSAIEGGAWKNKCTRKSLDTPFN